MKGEELTLTIDDMAYRGRGIARYDGLVYFLDGGLPGERVRARVVKRRSNFGEGEVVEVLEASPERVDPVCPLYAECPGCCYQHVSYKEEVRLKHLQLQNLLERMGGCCGSPMRDPVASSIELGYRNKITLREQGTENVPVLGYVGVDNRTIIDVACCPLAKPELNELLAEVRAKAECTAGIPRRTTFTFRETSKDGAICWRGGEQPPLTHLTEWTVLGDLVVPVRGFFQVNADVSGAVIGRVKELLETIQPEAVVDLYCGVGVFALVAAVSGSKWVMGIEADNRSIRAARRNAEHLGLSHIEFVTGKVEKLIDAALQGMNTTTGTIVLDPPRAGVPRPVLDVLGAARVRDLIYVSCAADTMARDVKILSKQGYRVVETGMLDMFPRTPYFESVTHLIADVNGSK